MNIKSLLLGSAAALAAVSGAQAADAIVAAEPEPVEYVRVCDAFGTGYFYIPGTETCLKIGGYVRTQYDFARDVKGMSGDSVARTSDWDAGTQAYVTFDAKSDTEYGTLTGYIALEADVDNPSEGTGVYVDEAYLQLGGFKAGYFYGFWDKGINGETDDLKTNSESNSIAYLYDGGSFQAGVSVDELEAANGKNFDGTKYVPYVNNGVGVSGIVSASLGGVAFDLIGGYDTKAEDGAIRALLSADVASIGTFQLAGIYSSGRNFYYNEAEWAVAGSFAIKATDKLTITPVPSTGRTSTS